jgi:hypothetical protein
MKKFSILFTVCAIASLSLTERAPGAGSTATGYSTKTGYMVTGTASDKVGFHGKTPIAQDANTVDAWTALQNIGIIAAGGTNPNITLTGTQTLTNKTLTDQIDSGCKAQTAAVSATSGTTGTTLTNLTGLSVNVTAGKTYIFQAHLTGTATTNSGVKFAIGGTATATAVTYTIKNYNGTTINAISTVTSLGTAGGAATAVWTNGDIYGAITVNAGGTLTVQAAQNASHADTTTVNALSSFRVTRTN